MKYLLVFFASLCFLLGCSSDEPLQRLKIGDKAPAFVGLDLQGEAFNLADFSGEPVIIRFWDTSCKYCKADTPVFNSLQDKYSDKGLHIAYINTLSNLEEVNQFVEDLGINFPVLMDDGGVIASAYSIRVVPQTIVIDRSHTIIGAISGGVSEEILLDLLGDMR